VYTVIPVSVVGNGTKSTLSKCLISEKNPSMSYINEMLLFCSSTIQGIE
jgi:hypothetical protein